MDDLLHDDRARARMKRLRQHHDACSRRYEQAQQEKTQIIEAKKNKESNDIRASEMEPVIRRKREQRSRGRTERREGDDQASEMEPVIRRKREQRSRGRTERREGDDQASEMEPVIRRKREQRSRGRTERREGDDQASEMEPVIRRKREQRSRGRTERREGDDQSLSSTDESESDCDDGSEYIPTPPSSDSEDCDSEGADFPKDREIEANTSFTQKVQKDELDVDSGDDLEHATDEGDGEKEEGMKTITVKKCQKGDKRKWDKKHFCIYCKKPQSKIARHLERKHHKEDDVARAICFPKKSKKRRLMLDQLRFKGDYNHNITILQTGKGQIVTYRQPSEDVNPHEYLPCNYCYGFFRKRELWKHEVSCKTRNVLPRENSRKRKRVQAAASRLIPMKLNTTKRCCKIIGRMMHDEVSVEVKSDSLICEYGDRLLEKHGSDPSKDGYVSQKMRELGRFVIAAKSLKPNVKNLTDILVPPMFKLAVDAAKKASGYTNSKYRYDRPSLGLKLGHSLKTVGDILIGNYVKAEDEVAANRVRSFLGLVSSEWNHYVSHRARTNLEENKWNKKEMIPLTEDIITLQKYLKSTEENARDKLMEGSNPKAYSMLSETLLSQIILFNRRRQGEAAKMLLQTYANKNTETLNEDVMQCLSKLEKDLSKDFTRVVIRGKRGRKVPVLLTREMTRSLDFLIEHRTQENNISETNKYVFARQNSECHIRGSDCLRKFANECNAKHPETLTSTQLRKHIATLCQIMNLKDHEMDQVAKFMGHDIRIHREYYRLTENTVQLAKMSKLLMAIECGTTVYKGKSLDEIDLELEVALSEKRKQGSTSEHVMMETSEQEEDELSRGQKKGPDPEESCDSDGPGTHTGTKAKGSSVRNELSRGQKKRPDPEESCDSDGPDTYIKTKMKRSSETDRNGSAAQMVKRRPWSAAEKKAVWRQLGSCITLLRVPGKDKCIECIDAEPALQSRHWRDIKNHVHNTIQTRKKRTSLN